MLQALYTFLCTKKMAEQENWMKVKQQWTSHPLFKLEIFQQKSASGEMKFLFMLLLT